jgi:hypothetical protein
MSAEELRDLREDIDKLEHQINRLNEVIREWSRAFKGSSAFNQIGIFDQLKEAVVSTKECRDQVEKLEESVNQKFIEQTEYFKNQLGGVVTQVGINTKRFDQHLDEVARFKERLSSVRRWISSLFSGAAFWKIVTVLVGLVTLNNIDDWGILDWIRHIIKELTRIF